jgi:acyl carrier protein
MNEAKILAIVSRVAGVSNVTPEDTFEHLGIDSTEAIGLIFEIEQEFNVAVPDEGVRNLRDVRGLLTLCATSPKWQNKA